jgi:hypothetical protein
MSRTREIILLVLWACALASCMELQTQTAAHPDGSHNAAGGYTEACDDLPGLIGDDC